MEAWLIDYRRSAEAAPWPFSHGFDDWPRSPQPLADPIDTLAAVSPLDGLDETPSVPTVLPRALPRGRYELAFFHDADYFYAALDAWDPPAVIDPADNPPGNLHALCFISPDDRLVLEFVHDDKGQLRASARAYGQGARRVEPPALDLAWDFAVDTVDGRERACWRIARRSLAPVMLGSMLRCSVSRVCLRAMESVAWGSFHIWGVRHDQMHPVYLVDQVRTPLWPTLRRLELHYDATREVGRFLLELDAPYQRDEHVPLGKSPERVSYNHVALRVNDRHVLLPMAERAQSPELPLLDGVNVVEVATVGGGTGDVRLVKRSGNRIVEPPLPRAPEPDLNQVRAAIKAEADRLVEQHEQRRRRGEPITFVAWRTYAAAALGRFYDWFERDPRYLQVLREEADFALSQQREDGTFSGFHMVKFGVPPAPWRGGAYDSGPAGDLWCVAARLLGDDKYRVASTRLLDAYRLYRIELNHNYAAFALFHLASHYRLTGDRRALERGLYYCRWCVTNNLLPCGVHGGHNYYTVYSSIILGAMAEFCLVLPDDEPMKALLRERCVRMLNELFARMQPDGMFDARDRYHVTLRLRLFGFLDVAFLLPPTSGEGRGEGRPPVTSMAEPGPNDAGAGMTPDTTRAPQPASRSDNLANLARLDAAFARVLAGSAPTESSPLFSLLNPSLIRYLKHRSTLLAGVTVDSAAVY